MSDTEHARFSPSKMERIIECPGSLALEETCPDSVSKYAAEGTAAHTLAQWTLTDGRFYAHAYQGRIIEVVEKRGTPLEERFEFEADEDMCDYVQKYVDDVLERIKNFELLGAKVTMYVEQRIDISRILGVPNQFGTSDCVLVVEFPNGKTLLVVIDLKYGMGVEVSAEENKQGMTYAIGTYDEHSLVNDIDRILIVINMPRLDYVTEWEIDAPTLLAFGETLKVGAQKALLQISLLKQSKDARRLELSPGEKHCRFCRAKGMCPALATRAIGAVTKLSQTTVADFDDLTAIQGEVKKHVTDSVATLDAAPIVKNLDGLELEDILGVVTREQLAEFMEAAPMIEDFLSAVRSRTEAELFAALNAPGHIPGWMLGTGRKGNRAWKSVTTVEDTMKSMRVKAEDMYSRKLISPTAAEKLFKDSVRRWNKLKEMIFQPEGKPSVVRDNDPKRKRLVVKPVADAFDNLDDDLSDLV